MDGRVLERISYLAGDADVLAAMPGVAARAPFDEGVISFLADVSKELMAGQRGGRHPDVAAFAFWIRNASMRQQKREHGFKDGAVRLGRGVAFHIAPSNVPVNFAYSLASGLVTGNANVVRVPSKAFPQVDVIVDAINKALASHVGMRGYISLIRYERDREINDALSSIADIRVVWGGDGTVARLRESPLPPRSTEVAFADRYSLAIIDSDAYMGMEDKEKVARDFYNDAYFSDQNACTSPRIVIWTGSRKGPAKTEFWDRLYKRVKGKYAYQDIQGVNKLTSALLAASGAGRGQGGGGGPYGARIVAHEDNLLVRVAVDRVDGRLMDFMDNGGFFFEYDCGDVMELEKLCGDKRCQTVGVLGDGGFLDPLLKSGIKGVDRIVDIGHMTDFGLVWDGYDLVSAMTRAVSGK